MQRTLLNQKGGSILAAIVTMVVLGAAATAVVNISGTDTKSASNNMQSSQAKAVANAGIQYALDKLNAGEVPDIVDKPFGSGTFTVESDPDSSRLTVTGRVGDAVSTQSLNADFSKNCVSAQVTSAISQNDQIFGVVLNKTCNVNAVLTSMSLSWDWSDCAQGVECDGDVSGVGEPPNNKFWVCHVPPGQPDNSQTLAVNQSGWTNGHDAGNGVLHNQDYVGPCTDDLPLVTSCPATGDQVADLQNCVQDTNEAIVNQVNVNAVTAFLAGSVPDENTEGVASSEQIDIVDTLLTTNGEHSIDMLFSENPPYGGWYVVTFNFLDGSEISKRFRVGQVPDDSVVVAEGFSVSNGVVTVEPSYQVQLDVIGSQLSCGEGGPEINVSTELCVDNACGSLFAGADVDGGETHTTVNGAANSEYVLRATGTLAGCNNFSRTYSSTNTSQVRTLRSGDQVPNLVAFGGQASVAEFLAPYTDVEGNIAIDANQVIILFEIGTNLNQDDENSADYQDLVTLLTVTEVQVAQGDNDDCSSDD